MALEIITRSDGSEIVPYNAAGFPLFTDARHVMLDPYRRATWHWHVDWEFASITQSPMLYHVDDREILLSPGEGIFVNSLRLHNNAVIDRSNPGYTCIVIHPDVLSGTLPVMEKCVRRLCGCSVMPFRVLHRTDPAESRILDCVEEIDLLERSEQEEKYLGIMARTAEITRLLLGFVPENAENVSQNRHLNAVYSMAAFIQRGFREPLSVAAIARAGYVSEGTCTSMFKRFFGTTPMNYVCHFRLEQSAALLRNTDASVTEIAGACGFGSHSFFSKCFRELYGISPSGFRKSMRNKEQVLRENDQTRTDLRAEKAGGSVLPAHGS